jgi:hypothetical protein
MIVVSEWERRVSLFGALEQNGGNSGESRTCPIHPEMHGMARPADFRGQMDAAFNPRAHSTRYRSALWIFS